MSSIHGGARHVWPFAGRTAELELIGQRLRVRRGGGVVIAGEPGLGKSRLAAEAVREAGAPVAQVVGTRAGASVPFGAFAHLFPAVPSPRDGLTVPLRWVTDALRPRAGGDRLVLVVDDAHLLDHASAALVLHLAQRGDTRLVVIAGRGGTAPDAVAALWKDDLLPRLDLGPLTQAESAQVLTGALGGHVEALTVRRLHRLTEGNVLFLRELVMTGVSTNVLSRAGGVWSWRGELPVAGRVRELVESRLGDLTAAEREVLEYAAFGEPLDDDLLEGLVESDALERMEARHLIVCGREGTRLRVRPASPLYGEVVRARCGPLRAKRVKRRLADVVEAHGDRPDDALRVAVWRLDSGGRPDPAVLIEGCRLAWVGYDVALAERLGRAALAAGGGLDAALALATPLVMGGGWEELEALLPVPGSGAATGDPGTADQAHAEYAAARAYGLMFGGEDPLPVLAEAAAAIGDPRARQDVLSAAALLHFYCGRVDDATEHIGLTRSLGRASPIAAARLAAAEATMLAHRGHAERCLDVVEAALRDLTEWREAEPVLLPALVCARLMAHVFAGDLDEAWEAVADGERLIGEGAGWDIGIAGGCGHRGQISRLRGSIGDALAWSRDGAGRLPAGPVGFAGLCLGELAHAAALTGDVVEARRALDAADERTLPAFRAIDFTVELARPWVLAAGGDLTGAVAAALAAADRAAEHGLRGYEMYALHDAVRLGAAVRTADGVAETIADRLDRLADEMDGPLPPVLARHAAAALVRDPAALSAAAKQFEQLGMLLHAAEAHAHAAGAYRRLGGPRLARASETSAWALAADCQGARTPALAELTAPGLTARQREIAHLAAGGLTNRQIADRLTVSIRTVANHLCGVYERLGVNDRTGLADLLGRLDTR
ncbi:helix-turn-helix transcriptional regulator [Actinomadura sp. HBU206391]|uniref:helix-turn-helix transcriptional regulator n=1 Tax=Actinomadura sp. HBU206391 TaxID=2731692 RepID=UPI00164F6AF0|nr:LuxR family transcriptional regulator [Actinomadura sp. HBU206391]MBC6462225.1 hypothetical protein [Actinomadura sp. HBU206391]